MGFKFWSRGYCVSTVGLEESVIRAYIRNQEERDKHEDQMTITYPSSSAARQAAGEEIETRVHPYAA